MKEDIRKRSDKAGLPPGTLIHIGRVKTTEPKISFMAFDKDQVWEMEVQHIEECLPFKDKAAVTWLNINGIHDLSIIEDVGRCFSLHPLLLEDIVNTHQRPKVEDYHDYIFVVLKMFDIVKPQHKIQMEQVSIILGTDYVISFQESEGDVFNPCRERIRSGVGRIREKGADYIAYSMIDAITDEYFEVLEYFGDQIEVVEETLVVNPDPSILKSIHTFKQEMIIIRKAMWPLREVIGFLERADMPLIKDSTTIYFRDIYDHIIQVIDTIEVFRDMLTGMLDIYLSSISYKMNEVMKVLTIIATIFMPLTFIAGVYGMNFKYMPELSKSWGYPLTLAVMLAVAFWMLLYFRKKKWL